MPRDADDFNQEEEDLDEKDVEEPVEDELAALFGKEEDDDEKDEAVDLGYEDDIKEEEEELGQ